jgi:hypothetical protein
MSSSQLNSVHDQPDPVYDMFVRKLVKLGVWYGLPVPPSWCRDHKTIGGTPIEWYYLESELKGGHRRKMRADEFKVGDRYGLNSSEQMYVAVKNDNGHEVVETGHDFVVFDKGQGTRLRVPAYLLRQLKEGEL